MTQLDLLRDAYINDRLELPEFEQFVEQIVAGNIVALPTDCWPTDMYRPPTWIASMLKTMWTDA